MKPLIVHKEKVAKDDFLITISKDKFEYMRLNKAKSSWIVKKRLKRKKREPKATNTSK